MKLSIIVPIYNVEKYLDECIKSILCQTFNDFELILVNDGSKDNCLAICHRWAKKDNRIRIIDKENGGVSSARNAGVAACCGEYIGFVDSDDYIDATMYEKLICAVLATNADIGICKMAIPGKSKGYGHDYPKDKPFYFSDDNPDWKKLFYQGDIDTFVMNKIYKAALIKKIPFEVTPLFEDKLFISKVYMKDPLMVFVDEDLYYYRTVANSAVRRYHPQRFEIIQKAYRYDLELNSAFEHNKYTDFINKELTGSVINCIVSEKCQKKKNRTAMFEKIRNSDEFKTIYPKTNSMKLSAKKRKLLKLLFEKNYFMLNNMLNMMNFVDAVKAIIKKYLPT